MRSLGVICCLFLTAASVHAAEYFFDSATGLDENVGTSEAAAFRSLEKLAKLALEPGDVVHLKRCCTFRGRLRSQGNGTEDKPIRLTAYGEGPKPEILGSIVLEGWQRYEGEIHKVAMTPEQFIGHKRVFGVFEYDEGVPVRLVRDREAIPTERGHFFFDEESLTLYVITADGAAPSEHRLEVAVIEQLVDLNERSWIEIDGLAFLFGNCRHLGVRESHDITIRGCASLFVGHYGNPNVMFTRNTTRARLLDCFLYENINGGVFISSGASECVVFGCTIVKCASNDGVTLHSGGRDEHGVRQGITGDHCIVENNVIGLCPEESIDITSGDHHIIRGNICYGNGNPGIIVGHDSDHILIENNICFGNRRSGIQVQGKAEEGARGYNRVIRNLVYDNGYPGLEIAMNNTEVLNNTVVNSRERVAIRINPASEGSVLRNNLILTLDLTIPHPSLHFIRCTPAGLGAKLSHNLFFHAGDVRKPEVFFPVGSLIRTDDGAFTLESFLAKYGTGEASFVAEPGFRDTDDGYYLLSPDSPAVDAGTDVGLPFMGKTPDLGWKELGSEDTAPKYPPFLIDGEDDEAKILYLWGKSDTLPPGN